MTLPLLHGVVGGLSALLIVVIAAAFVPVAFGNHVLPGVMVGQVALAGVHYADLDALLAEYERQLGHQVVELTVRDRQATHTLAELGFTLGRAATIERIAALPWSHIQRGGGRVVPVVQLNHAALTDSLAASFAGVLTLPQDATLRLTSSSTVEVVPGKAGESADVAALAHAVADRMANDDWPVPIELAVVTKEPEITDEEVTAAQAFARELMRDGMELIFADQTWPLTPFTLRRLLVFAPQADPAARNNYVLGLSLHEAELVSYLEKTLAPEINRPAQDARFVRTDDGRVEQFVVAQDGQALDIPATTAAVTRQIENRQRQVALAVAVTKPPVASNDDIETLGITTLLAQGESDFAGSPRNRIHNITVGTERYHGLLVAPGQEFSFNQFLGPVDGAHGFLPELVIKHNVTTPEFGGGLCQVSTTLFRAAVNSGLAITDRRNHAYPVRYYGKPGFDATIYPPYTDLRFTNNTPGYILIQARLEGTQLAFEFWGTDDGREVLVEGPHTYDHRPDGAVKATLTQTVTRAGETLIEETFYSRYKSPNLFPRVVAANDPTSPAPASTTPVPAQPNEQPTSTPSQPAPAAPAAPAPAPAST